MKRVGLALGVLLYAPTAAAKGEGGGVFAFCYGQDILFAYAVGLPEEVPDMVVVATNFGLLISRDAGAAFRWICPFAYGAFVDSDFTILSLPGLASVDTQIRPVVDT